MDSGHSTERGFQFILSNYIIAIFEVIKKNVAFYKKTLRQDWESSEKTVSKWECGNGLPEVIYMEPLCQILGITVNELLAGKTAKSILIYYSARLAVFDI